MKACVIYRGPSLIDGSPIVAIATWTAQNKKTGAVVQTYILRADMPPMLANRTGADFAICGNCPLKGAPTSDAGRKIAVGRACYVRLDQGPTAVFKAWQRGRYPVAENSAAIAAMGARRMVRLGTYGDPGAVPIAIWQALVSKAQGWTGYTHNGTNEELFDLAMASVESKADARAHWAAGRRTFRVIRDLADMVPGREILCPASAEAGYRTTCAKCRLCAGTATRSSKSIAIVAHGTGARFAA